MIATPSRTLLVVADNPDTQALILEHARAKGHSVIAATSPALGLTTFDMTQPDIVIMDLFLPDQEGMTLVKQIRQRRPTCPVVLLSDAGHDASTMEGLRAGALDYVQQPIHEEAFAQVLQRAIHSLPAFWQQVSGYNPILYLIDGFRYGFFGISDISPWRSLGVALTCFIVLSAVALGLLRHGYKLRN